MSKKSWMRITGAITAVWRWYTKTPLSTDRGAPYNGSLGSLVVFIGSLCGNRADTTRTYGLWWTTEGFIGGYSGPNLPQTWKYVNTTRKRPNDQATRDQASATSDTPDMTRGRAHGQKRDFVNHYKMMFPPIFLSSVARQRQS